MRRAFLFMLPLLAACQDSGSPADQAAEDQHDVALVERANSSLPPVEEVVPEPIGAPDIERYDLVGAACNHAPGTSLGTLVIAREADAYVKINGAVERFAADPGARELPQHSRSLYSGKNHSLRLQIAGDGKPMPDGKADYEGTVEIRDPHGRVVYSGSGLARCGTS